MRAAGQKADTVKQASSNFTSCTTASVHFEKSHALLSRELKEQTGCWFITKSLLAWLFRLFIYKQSKVNNIFGVFYNIFLEFENAVNDFDMALVRRSKKVYRI